MMSEVSFAFRTTGSDLSLALPKRQREKALRVLGERQVADMDASLVDGLPANVRRVWEYGLLHPGGVPARSTQEALALSPKTVKRAHAALRDLGLAESRDTMSRAGRISSWHYRLEPAVAPLNDLGMGSRGSGPLTPCQDLINMPLSSADGQEMEVAPVAVNYRKSGSQYLISIDDQRVGDEVLAVALPVVHPSEPADDELAPMLNFEAPAAPTPVAYKPDPISMTRGLWTDPSYPLLARYRELATEKGHRVYPDQAKRIAETLAVYAMDVSEAEALEFVEHLFEKARAPYRANVVAEFIGRWAAGAASRRFKRLAS